MFYICYAIVVKLKIKLKIMKKTNVNSYILNIKYKVLLLLIILFFTSSAIVNNNANMVDSKYVIIESYNQHINDFYVKTVKDRAKQQLLNEVNTYIKLEHPKSKINSSILVEQCLKYDIDIVFVISQGIIESHLGTKGRASFTNSVWNVGSFDCGKTIYKYKDPNESIEPYLKLLREKYFISIVKKGNDIDTIKRDELNILKNGYHNVNGHRFASSETYEKRILLMMAIIDSKTKISFYQSLYKLDSVKIVENFLPLKNI